MAVENLVLPKGEAVELLARPVAILQAQVVNFIYLNLVCLVVVGVYIVVAFTVAANTVLRLLTTLRYDLLKRFTVCNAKCEALHQTAVCGLCHPTPNRDLC